MNLASADTLSKKARLEAIQAGLRARTENQSPNQPAQPTVPDQADALPFTNGVEAESPASDTTTEVGQEVEPPPVRYSFLGLPPSQGSESGAVLRTPKKRPSSILDGKQGLFGSSSALLTPPQTIKQTHRTEAFGPSASAGGSSRPEPVTPTRNKGKERASARFDEFMQSQVGHPASPWLTPLTPFQENDNPFVDTPSLSFKRKLTSDASLDAHSQGSSSAPTTGERITADMREMLGTIDTLRTWAERFAVLDPLQYIERLERQRSSLEIADAAKKRRIKELIEEIQRKDELITHLQGGRR
ncbi:hypothetical protein OG21DRAFT_1525954 [Imleria badia]|nr:hypothetical protein OG21DRAFT_1525954 [Imleria badia]